MNYPLKFELDRRQGVLNIGYGAGSSPTFGTVLVADGTAAAPSIAFAADSDTGFYRFGANTVGLSSGGVLGLRMGRIESGNPRGYVAGGSNTGVINFNDSGAVTIDAGTGGGANQNITLTPSGTGMVDIFSSNDASFGNVLRVLTPTLSSGNSALILLGKAGAANQSAFINYFYSSTAALGRLDFGHNGTTGQVSLMQTGRFLIGTGVTDSGALLQVGTNTTTSAGGMVFGTDTFLYRIAAGALQLQGGTAPGFFVAGQCSGYFQSLNATTFSLGSVTAGASVVISSGGNVTALTLDSSQGAIFAGTIFAKKSAGTAVFAVDTTSGSDLTIANNAVAYPFSNANNFAGLIVVTDTSNTGNSAVFLTSASNMILVSQTGSSFSNTSGTAAKTNFYISGGVVVIENKSGVSTNYSVQAHRTRTTS
jgi:hypothetical protein